MSRTKKDSKKEKKERVPELRKKKMKAYVGDKHIGSLKFVPEAGQGKGITKEGKLVAKNANRSRKKAARREAKQNIKKNLGDA